MRTRLCESYRRDEQEPQCVVISAQGWREAAIEVVQPGAIVKPSMSSGGTDGREFRSAGIPTYGAGAITLVRPDDFRAHGIDERLPINSYFDQLIFWDVLLKDLAGGQG